MPLTKQCCQAKVKMLFHKSTVEKFIQSLLEKNLRDLAVHIWLAEMRKAEKSG